MKAVDKLAYHREKMQATRYEYPRPREWNFRSAVSTLVSLTNKKLLAEAFLNNEDERNVRKQSEIKPIHSTGISGIIRYDPTPAAARKYTGVFRSGGVGVVRLSTMIPSQAFGIFIPSLAIKILTDDQPSVNIHAMYSLDGQGNDCFFFRNALSTSLDPPSGCIMRLIHSQLNSSLPYVSPVSCLRPRNALTLPLIEAAKITSNGKIMSRAVAPDRVSFIPQIKDNSGNELKHEFRDYIERNVKAPVVLYEMLDQDGMTIGDLVLTENFSVSEHGDNMAFKHQQVSR